MLILTILLDVSTDLETGSLSVSKVTFMGIEHNLAYWIRQSQSDKTVFALGPLPIKRRIEYLVSIRKKEREKVDVHVARIVQRSIGRKAKARAPS